MRTEIETIYREESRRVLATLIRLLGDFEVAEEAMHEAFAVAMAQWPVDGVPQNPRAWLVSTGRFKAIDQLRRKSRFETPLDDQAEDIESQPPNLEADEIEDDRMRLIFTCCHPSLAEPAKVALTLREVCGLTTEEIARAYLVGASTMAQRIVRAKHKIRSAMIPYEVPGPSELAERMASVMEVIYLVFNEGYAASSGESVTRVDLSAEAIRLARLLLELQPSAEGQGLLALMLLHDARRSTRATAAGDIVLLEDQDRSQWDAHQIEEGRELLMASLNSRAFGPYTLQAAIAAVHADAVTFADTDWDEITGLYDALFEMNPSPIVALNRAVAIAMRDGAMSGLELIDDILAGGKLDEYHLAWAARADLCRRLGRIDEAREAYQRAIALAKQGPERRFLERRLKALAQNHS